MTTNSSAEGRAGFPRKTRYDNSAHFHCRMIAAVLEQFDGIKQRPGSNNAELVENQSKHHMVHYSPETRNGDLSPNTISLILQFRSITTYHLRWKEKSGNYTVYQIIRLHCRLKCRNYTLSRK